MNVIVLMNDTFRRDHMGAYGNDWIRTPNFDHLAEQSAVFDRAYIASYPTIPNRWDLATGRYGFPTRGWEPLDPNDVTLAQILTGAGYTTQLIYDPPQIGYHNYDYTRGFKTWWWVRGQHADPYMSDPEVPQPIGAQWHKVKSVEGMRLFRRNQGIQRYDRDHTISRIAQSAIDWLETNHRQEKFFLWVDMWDPHEPFDPPWYDIAHYHDPDFDGDRVYYPPYGRANFLDDAERAYVKALYAGLVTQVDRWVGRILETLERLQLDKNTLVLQLTDHGHLFGEHDLEGKPGGQLGNLYETTTRVPMMMRHPDGLGAGKRIQGLAQPVDVLPTILEFLGVDPKKKSDGESGQILDFGAAGGEQEIHGRSLWPMVQSEAGSIRDHVVSGRFPAVVDGEQRQPGVGHLFDGWVGSGRVIEALTVTEEKWAMICSPHDRESELYDLAADPDQLNNVIGDHPDRAARMYQQAVDALRAGGASDARLRPFLEDIGSEPLSDSEPLWMFRDDRGVAIAYPTESEAEAVGRDAEGNPIRKIEKTTFGKVLADDEKNLVFVHGQYYWASDLT
ncbi:MAG: sulfatase [Chloroflexi bacterium]|nr:sulfatase [Chloroflexota bacterium]